MADHISQSGDRASKIHEHYYGILDTYNQQEEDALHELETCKDEDYVHALARLEQVVMNKKRVLDIKNKGRHNQMQSTQSEARPSQTRNIVPAHSQPFAQDSRANQYGGRSVQAPAGVVSAQTSPAAFPTGHPDTLLQLPRGHQATNQSNTSYPSTAQQASVDHFTSWSMLLQQRLGDQDRSQWRNDMKRRLVAIYPTIDWRPESHKWVDVRCSICHTNLIAQGRPFQGVKGLTAHFGKKHPMGSKSDWDKCFDQKLTDDDVLGIYERRPDAYKVDGYLRLDGSQQHGPGDDTGTI